MKIIGFIASPHRNGNTAWVVNKILEGAGEQGAETRSWCAGDVNITPCSGCLACHNGLGKCIVNDDMQEIYTALESADALVIGSPVYMGQMSGQAKVFTDRLFAQINPRFSPHYKPRDIKMKLVLPFTQGNPNPEMFKAYFDYIKHVFELLEFDVQSVPVITGMRSEPAQEQEGLLAAMKSIGAALVLPK